MKEKNVPNIHVRLRATTNEKADEMANDILRVCKDRGLSLADLEDLSIILPQRVEGVIESAKEKITDY